MKFEINSITIGDLMVLIDGDKIDLKPSYQRNFIWSKEDQGDLIDSIIKGYPLPNFFVYKRLDGIFEMVDGQQRARSIYKFVTGQISRSNKEFFKDIQFKNFLDYKLNWTVISDLTKDDSLEEFYVLVNKKGKHLNIPELNKAEFANSKFLNFVESLLDYQPLINLDLFSDAAAVRMNDRSYIEELIAYLVLGIGDKKQPVEKLYKTDISAKDIELIRAKFNKIIGIIEKLDSVIPIRETRYKQKNDFYTLFNFVNENINLKYPTFETQYKCLAFLDNFISPSQEDCPPLKNYAINCVSQSNSKKAREQRLDFFNTVLKNKNVDTNEDFKLVLNFLAQINYQFKLQQIEEFQLLDVDSIERINQVD